MPFILLHEMCGAKSISKWRNLTITCLEDNLKNEAKKISFLWPRCQLIYSEANFLAPASSSCLDIFLLFLRFFPSIWHHCTGGRAKVWFRLDKSCLTAISGYDRPSCSASFAYFLFPSDPNESQGLQLQFGNVGDFCVSRPHPQVSAILSIWNSRHGYWFYELTLLAHKQCDSPRTQTGRNEGDHGLLWATLLSRLSLCRSIFYPEVLNTTQFAYWVVISVQAYIYNKGGPSTSSSSSRLNNSGGVTPRGTGRPDPGDRELVTLSNFLCCLEKLLVQVETTAPPPKRSLRRSRKERTGKTATPLAPASTPCLSSSGASRPGGSSDAADSSGGAGGFRGLSATTSSHDSRGEEASDEASDYDSLGSVSCCLWENCRTRCFCWSIHLSIGRVILEIN